jgi:hypothetical protein
MGKKRYNHDDETNEEDFEGSGRLSGQDSLFDRRGDHDEDEEFDEGEDLIDVEELIEEKKSEAYNDDFDVDKAKEQKKKKRIATVKPKLIGKHSLAYDTIFKGKLPPIEGMERLAGDTFKEYFFSSNVFKL